MVGFGVNGHIYTLSMHFVDVIYWVWLEGPGDEEQMRCSHVTLVEIPPVAWDLLGIELQMIDHGR